MSILDNITDKVTKTAKAAAKKSGDIVEVTKLNISIGAEEDKIEKLYKQIGKEVFNKYQDIEQIPVDIKSYCEEIQKHMENIAQMRNKINELRKIKYCPSCNHEIDYDALYCPKCGAKQGEPTENKENEVENERKCPSCGKKLSEGDEFCSFCGTKV